MDFAITYEILSSTYIEGMDYQKKCFWCGEKLKRYYRLKVKKTIGRTGIHSYNIEDTIYCNYECLNYLPDVKKDTIEGDESSDM
jgi:hypothetical protein